MKHGLIIIVWTLPIPNNILVYETSIIYQLYGRYQIVFWVFWILILFRFYSTSYGSKVLSFWKIMRHFHVESWVVLSVARVHYIYIYMLQFAFIDDVQWQLKLKVVSFCSNEVEFVLYLCMYSVQKSCYSCIITM